MARISPEATAFAHRGNEALVVVPWSSGAYGNFLSEASVASVAAAYRGATYARLAQIEAIYDRENVFNQNLNIKPAPDAQA